MRPLKLRDRSSTLTVTLQTNRKDNGNFWEYNNAINYGHYFSVSRLNCVDKQRSNASSTPPQFKQNEPHHVNIFCARPTNIQLVIMSIPTRGKYTRVTSRDGENYLLSPVLSVHIHPQTFHRPVLPFSCGTAAVGCYDIIDCLVPASQVNFIMIDPRALPMHKLCLQCNMRKFFLEYFQIA